jgi:acyl-CoA reductase-like NAD-dependent aldehyde dehydrogenase
MATACQLARDQGVDPGSLAYNCWHGRQWIAETNVAHMAECGDKECDWVCCRAARGLPPPTPQEIAEWRRRHNEEVRAERERLAEIKARTMAKILADREARRQRNATRNGRVKGR